jgi:hypothetical protein
MLASTSGSATVVVARRRCALLGQGAQLNVPEEVFESLSTPLPMTAVVRACSLGADGILFHHTRARSLPHQWAAPIGQRWGAGAIP